MCGIAGFFNLQSSKKEWYNETLESMTSSILHRGPDAQDYWYDEDNHIGLGHVRLSILDLSKAGAQPMKSHCDRYIFVYNGEVYNYQEIQNELEREFGRMEWNGTSDTEIMLQAFSKWGVKKTLQQCNGMFAFALWDKQKQELTIGRDRMGQKPLFYGYVGNDFVFGSELKPLKKHSQWKGDICTDTLDIYLRMGYVPTPYSIYKNIFKLMPSSFIVIKKSDLARKNYGSLTEYWSLKGIYEQGTHKESLSHDLKKVEELLTDSVKKRMIADVPLGAFLSGGYDSSLIVALMQKENSKKVNTFSIGFDDNNFNEAVYAKEISKILGTDHNELYVSPKQVLDLFPKMTEIYDEPFADPSQFPTFIVSKLAREKVTVAISGDAGDELFGGYERYINFPKRWQKSKFIPNGLAKIAKNSLKNSSLIYKNTLVKNIERYGHLFSTNDRNNYYFEQISLMSNPESILKNKCNSITFFNNENLKLRHDSFEEEMMYTDLRTFVLDDILVKVDRASMANSLEVRNPYLDHRLIEYAARIPISRKINDNKTKWLTRQILYKHLPQSLMDRPKSGFMIPISSWLKNDLKDMAYDLLNIDKLNNQGIFDGKKVNLLLNLHNSGGKVHGHLIWNLIAFQNWYDNE
jgi:asparagine synthase (glutamine-hydrolysing)